MPAHSSAVYIGVCGFAVAIDRSTGRELWRTALKGSEFVNIALQDGELYASARGELFRLDPSTGAIVWHNKLPGLGWGIVTIAGGGVAAPAEKKRRDEATAAAATTT